MLTDLAITGKPAQFGRGVMQDVSDKLLGQFVACLESRLAGGAPEAPGEPAPAAADPRHRGDGACCSGGTAPASRRPRRAPARRRPRPPRADDALDLGATVLPVLVKSYWKQGAAGLAVVALHHLAGDARLGHAWTHAVDLGRQQRLDPDDGDQPDEQASPPR